MYFEICRYLETCVNFKVRRTCIKRVQVVMYITSYMFPALSALNFNNSLNRISYQFGPRAQSRTVRPSNPTIGLNCVQTAVVFRLQASVYRVGPSSIILSNKISLQSSVSNPQFAEILPAHLPSQNLHLPANPLYPIIILPFVSAKVQKRAYAILISWFRLLDVCSFL